LIDTHCHLLPGIDDGPKSMDGTLELARSLARSGVHSVVCTPHFSRRYPTDHLVAADALEEVRRVLDEEGVPLKLGLAAEVGSAAAVDASEGELLDRRLGERHLLVELEPATPAGIVEVVLDRARQIELRPVFAHPERCRAVRSQPHVLDDARAEGALVQVVAQSLSGRWGDEARTVGWHLVEAGRADLLASDAHKREQAGARLRSVLEELTRRFGATALEELTETGPRKLLGPASRLR
jgi:protein-tyrosine phosphatase